MRARPLVGLGVDVATHSIALATLDTVSRVCTWTLPLPKVDPARRLVAARQRVYAIGVRADAAVVERPFAVGGRKTGQALPALAAVCAEAIQATDPGMAVWEDVGASSWKLEAVGRGNADKAACMEHARVLGYVGVSQDEADAVCMAQCALERLLAAVGEAA